MFARLRVGVTWVLLAATAVLGGGVPAGAQGPVGPPDAPDAYALLALSKMHVSGSISLLTGSLGVNEKEGALEVDGGVPVQLNTADGVIASRKADLFMPSECTSAAFFADTITGGSSETCGAAPRQDLPEGKPPLIPDVKSSAICDLPAQFPNFPECEASAPVTVDAGTDESLPPGKYGALTINGGTLRLQGGNYVFCSVTMNNGSEVVAEAPSVLLVVDSFDVLPNSQINVDGAPQDLRVLVNGKQNAVNIAGGTPLVPVFSGQPAAHPVPLATTTCSFTPVVSRSFGINTTAVVAQLCALEKPAILNLFSATILGTFVADEINVGNIQGGNVVPTTTSSTSTTSTSTTTTSTTSATSTSTTSTSSSTTATTTPTSTTSTSSTTVPTTTSTSTSSTTLVPPTTSVPPPTSTTTSSSTSTSVSVPVSTSTSTSSSISMPPTTSTSLPPCNPLRLTLVSVKPKRSNPSKGTLKVHGVLADAGWAGVDPQQSGVALGVQRIAGLSTCCTIEQQHWMKRGPAHFKFWNMRRTVCPPLSDMQIKVSREGRATFRFFAPEIDLTGTGSPELKLGAVVGNRCSVGNVSLTSLRLKRNGRLVYP